MLSSGHILTSNHISALKRVGVLAVNILEMSGLDMDDANQRLSDEVRIETMTSVQSFIEENFAGKNYRQLLASVKNIVAEILSGKTPMGGLAEISAYDAYTYAHSVDVCALSVAIGHEKNLSHTTLVKLGIGSLLHDLGKTQIPLEILNKPGELTGEELEKIREHPTLGHHMVRNDFDEEISPLAAQIILNHHERFNGSGYPNGLSNSELSKFDMICGIADMYNAMTTDRVYRKALPYSEAYEMLLGSAGNYFSIDVVQAFAQVVEPYPLGTLVRMSNGKSACVVGSNPTLPTRPIVKILPTKQVIDLSQNLSMVIKSQLPPSEIIRLVETKDS